MIGYSHIDPVWLWSRAEGMQEVKATFSSALARLKEFPDFKFTHTSIAFLSWLKENCPEQFSEIDGYIKEGRWEIVGGMWIEPDCDLPCGESLIRQLLYGTAFVRENFGTEVTVGFNPDSFGHGANLPAILNGCGIHNYVVSRPGKSSVKLPGLFVWTSPDGSAVTTERTGGEYMAWTRPALEFNISESREELAMLDYDKMAVFYGVGNHGGGPTVENIRTIYEMRAEDREDELDFSTLEDFFEILDRERLPVVTGELGRIFYGCYSSDRQIKEKNRRAEWTLIKAEAVAAMAAGLGVKTFCYPAQRLERAWKELLFNQFHDVLAGTAIEPSRTQACREFDLAAAEAGHIIDDGVQAIANAFDTRGDGFPLVLVNPVGARFQGVFCANVYVPRAQKKPLRMKDFKGKELSCCETDYKNDAKESRKSILFEADVPAFGYAVYRVTGEGPNETDTAPAVSASPKGMDNGVLQVSFDEVTGCPSSLVKDGRQLLCAPCSVAVFYDDRGAWGETVFEGKRLGSFTVARTYVIESNPMRAVVRTLLSWEKSELRLDYILEKGSDMLKIEARLHNMEKHRQICYCVPVLAAEPSVMTETAFLAEKKIRCDDKNCEHYQHRFADVTDVDGGGIAVFNDGVYACEQVESEYRLILSRSSVYARGAGGPLEEDMSAGFMDQGAFDYKISLLAHARSVPMQRLFSEADFLHMPPEYLGDSNHAGKNWRSCGSLLSLELDNAAVSCIKAGLSEPGSLILRVFETEGAGGHVTAGRGAVRLEAELSPYQIRTFRLSESGFTECDMLERSKGRKMADKDGKHTVNGV